MHWNDWEKKFYCIKINTEIHTKLDDFKSHKAPYIFRCEWMVWGPFYMHAFYDHMKKKKKTIHYDTTFTNPSVVQTHICTHPTHWREWLHSIEAKRIYTWIECEKNWPKWAKHISTKKRKIDNCVFVLANAHERMLVCACNSNRNHLYPYSVHTCTFRCCLIARPQQYS